MIRRPLQHALDELRFGRTGTLNLRSSLPTAAEAVKRAESWLRMKQAEGAREVLVVTGRGNQSFAGISVVREAVRRLLGFLSTRGVVLDHSEHSAGSFVVRIAPLNAATSRSASRAPETIAVPLDPPTLEGLSDVTRERLRVLAVGTLEGLGIRDAPPAFVRDEMIRQCAHLAASIAHGVTTAADREAKLQFAIARAIERLDDDQR